MYNYERLIKSYRTVLSKFAAKSGEYDSFSENFAHARFKKKFQRPDVALTNSLAEETWLNWIEHDRTLPTSPNMFFLGGAEGAYWYRARAFLKKRLREVDFTDSTLVSFSAGSSFTPNKGEGSIEARLTSVRNPWDSTVEAFEQFALIAYNHWGLKKAAKWRFRRQMRLKGLSKRELIKRNKTLYQHALMLVEIGTLDKNDVGFWLFRRNLLEVVKFVKNESSENEDHDEFLNRQILGSRFSTVPKDNDARRPINLEPFCNLMVQKVIGAHIRRSIKRIWKKDLDHVPAIQRRRVADSKISTIDLKSASDSFSRALVSFIIPEPLFKQMDACRSPFIFGPDGAWHFVNKMSSMGNGFTFEMMSLILLTITRQIDQSATVFGDDIIVKTKHAPLAIRLIEKAGLIVNKDKTFIDGPFRESCGSNYHAEEGYIESFDFEWPETVHDCVVLYNKTKRLSYFYSSFVQLENDLRRLIPNALQGAPDHDLLEPPKGEFKDWVSKGTLVLSGKPHLLASYSAFNEWLSETVCDEVDHDIPALPLSTFFRTGTDQKSRGADKLRRRDLRRIKRYARDLQISGGTHLSLCVGFKPVNRTRTNKLVSLPINMIGKYAMYLHAGRKTDDTIRGDVKWAQETYVILDERPTKLSSLLKLFRKESEELRTSHVRE